MIILVPGEGGTGKSHTIQAITTNFVCRKIKGWLVKGAYTGIAASIIDGSTLHVITANRRRCLFEGHDLLRR